MYAFVARIAKVGVDCKGQGVTIVLEAGLRVSNQKVLKEHEPLDSVP